VNGTVGAEESASEKADRQAPGAGGREGGVNGAHDRALAQATGRALAGGPERHHEKSSEQGKLPVRERVARLLDPGTFAEEALLANWQEEGLGADGVVTGLGRIGGRPVALMANDPTVKAGSWGPKTVEKILRVQERALELRTPMVYLVDSAGARITEQVQMFPGRRGAGRIFHNQVKLSGLVPQVCVLFGPSAAGGAYIPAFCDIVIMRDGNASMYLGSPRMAQMVIGEDVTLEEMGGARMHTGVSGCGHMLVQSDAEGIDAAVRYLSYLPNNWEARPPEEARRPEVCPPDPPAAERLDPASAAGSPTTDPSPFSFSSSTAPAPPAAPSSPSTAMPNSPTPIGELIPADENKPFDMKLLLDALVDADSFMEIHARWAKELIVGFARLDGRAVGIVASQPKVKGGVLFVDSADKAARFIWTCNAFNVPLLFLADVPGFMIGTQVERQGIIRHGAKMISAVSEATVPKISVVVRKAYGAGLYAMAGPAFDPDCCLALPSASIAVMGPQAAINAVYYNQLQAIADEAERSAETERLRAEYAADIDILHLASEMVVDAVIEPDDLRAELIARFALAAGRRREWPARNNPITPV
jgi:methylmalonyl-CoA decarboxylase subunit alpha